MIKGLYTSATSMSPRMFRQEVAANNLANINTAGFKKDRFFLRTLMRADRILSESEMGIAGQIITDYEEGALNHTGSPLDLALRGEGFFTVDTPQGMRYTRNGHFALNTDGQLVTSEGFVVLGEDGPVEIHGKNVLIAENGEITVDGNVVGRLLITDFEKPYNLKKLGDSLFVPRSEGEAEGVAENVVVRQGFLEGSNVRVVEEMVRMISLSRSYESDQKAIQYQDEALGKAVNEVGRV